MKLDKTSASGASGGILFCEAQLMVEVTASLGWIMKLFFFLKRWMQVRLTSLGWVGDPSQKKNNTTTLVDSLGNIKSYMRPNWSWGRWSCENCPALFLKKRWTKPPNGVVYARRSGVGPKQFAAQSRPAKGFGWPRWLVIPHCLGKSSVDGLRSAIAILHCCGWDLKQFSEKGMIFGHGCMGKCHDKTCIMSSYILPWLLWIGMGTEW